MRFERACFITYGNCKDEKAQIKWVHGRVLKCQKGTHNLLPWKKVYVHLGYIFICCQNSKCNNWLISLRVTFSLY